MTITTRYTGKLSIEPPLKAPEIEALHAFFGSRRIRTALGPLDCRDLDMGHPDVIDYNEPPEGQPGLHCDLEILEDGAALGWNGHESTGPDLHKWITYVIDHLLKPGAEFDIRERDFNLAHLDDGNLLWSFTFDHEVSGTLAAMADGTGEVWKILVKDNEVSTEDVRLDLAAPQDEEVEEDEDDGDTEDR
jgi:hypothetical protein